MTYINSKLVDLGMSLTCKLYFQYFTTVRVIHDTIFYPKIELEIFYALSRHARDKKLVPISGPGPGLSFETGYGTGTK